jgi:apolipoprotein D and lipocalin family protein
MSIRTLLLPAIAMSMFAGCSSSKLPPLETVPEVDIERFMGDWYVIASIPTRIERSAYNAVESYRLEPDGTIATTFSFRQGGFDGEEKVYNPRGFIRDRESKAVWGMQFIWPIKADYRIVYLDEDYNQTIIGRNKRDYVWIMAREPSIPEAEYDELVSLIRSFGYDTSLIRRVPQQWQ